MAQHDAFRFARGSRGIDQATSAGPFYRRDIVCEFTVGGLTVGDDIIPTEMPDAVRYRLRQRVDGDHGLGVGGLGRRGQQRLGQRWGRYDRGGAAAVRQHMLMVGDGVRRIGGHRDCADRHDRQIRDQPFRPALRDQGHPVAAVDPGGAQPVGQGGHLVRDLTPRQRVPVVILFPPKKRPVAENFGPFKEQGRQIGYCRVVHAFPFPPNWQFVLASSVRRLLTRVSHPRFGREAEAAIF